MYAKVRVINLFTFVYIYLVLDDFITSILLYIDDVHDLFSD